MGQRQFAIGGRRLVLAKQQVNAAPENLRAASFDGYLLTGHWLLLSPVPVPGAGEMLIFASFVGCHHNKRCNDGFLLDLL
jgi:hypothetical protein